MREDQLAALSALGLTDSQFVAVVKIFAMRSQNAIRQQRYRERREATSVTNNVTACVTNNVTGDATNNVTSNAPPSCARGGDNLQDSEGPCSALLCSAWPERDLARHLTDAVSSPRLDLAKTPGLVTSAGIIGRWRAAGATWDTVVTVVKGKSAPPGGPISSWKYFDGAILQMTADLQAAPVLPPPTAARSNVIPMSFAERDAEMRERVKRKLIAEEEARNGQHDR